MAVFLDYWRESFSIMGNNLTLKCIDPTSTLTKNKKYVGTETMVSNGNWVISYDQPRYLVKNDRGNMMNVSRNRFKVV